MDKTNTNKSTKKEARLTARVKDTLTLEVRVSFTYLQ